VFQFDFLNDDFTMLPKPLQAIINDPEKRKKLVIYINPPYAEAWTIDQFSLAKVSIKLVLQRQALRFMRSTSKRL
jgi:16S rRNA G966 N2-methylase RsmD